MRYLVNESETYAKPLPKRMIHGEISLEPYVDLSAEKSELEKLRERERETDGSKTTKRREKRPPRETG